MLFRAHDKSVLWLAICSSFLIVNPTYAEETFGFDGGLTSIFQFPNTGALAASHTLSGDVNMYYDLKDARVYAHVEGCTTPAQSSAAHLLPQSNGDAGSALDSRNQGRFQLSELFMTWRVFPQITLDAGLIDATAYMDGSVINNDEVTQFISAPLVNNPIVDFPDYALGAVVQKDFGNNLVGRLLVSSSHGLADNPGRNYSQAFEVGGDEKGVFIDTEISYQTFKKIFTFGMWTHTAPHQSLSNPNNVTQQNFGGYLNGYQNFGKHSVEGRLAYANPEVSSGEIFVALAYEYQRPNWVFGSGYSWTKASNSITDKRYLENNQLVEVYLRYRLFNTLDITPSLQFFENPVYDKDEVKLSKSLMSASVRVSYLF